MKTLLTAVVAGGMSLAFSFSARGVDTEFVIFKAAASLPVLYVEEGQSVDKQLTKLLAAKEIINLSLGRALDFKHPVAADAKKEVLAMAVAYEDDGQPPGTVDPPVLIAVPKTRLILWNPLAPVLADRWVKTLATVTELEYDRLFTASGEKGQGFGTVVIPEGAPGDNKFFAITFHGTGKLTQAVYGFSTVPGAPQPGSLKTIAFSMTGLGGRVKFNFTNATNPSPGKLINGVVVKGMVTTTGTPLGTIFRDEGF